MASLFSKSENLTLPWCLVASADFAVYRTLCTVLEVGPEIQSLARIPSRATSGLGMLIRRYLQMYKSGDMPHHL